MRNPGLEFELLKFCSKLRKTKPFDNFTDKEFLLQLADGFEAILYNFDEILDDKKESGFLSIDFERQYWTQVEIDEIRKEADVLYRLLSGVQHPEEYSHLSGRTKAKIKSFSQRPEE